MSEGFRSFRALTAFVDGELAKFTQLKAAITDVAAFHDQLPTIKRELEVAEADFAATTQRTEAAKAAHEVLLGQFREQRKEQHAAIQKDQQERVTQREHFKQEQAAWHADIARARATLADLERSIGSKKAELSTLEQDLRRTVNAVLRN